MKQEVVFLIGLLQCTLIAGCRNADPIPGIVQGASMAPTFLGEHYQQNCDDCGANLIYGANRKGPPGRIVCFNCGFRDNKSSDAQIVPPQQVTIHRADELKRWDVVAFRLPDSGEIGIKRIVGLPGEEINIDNGDLFIKGTILSKSLEIQKQMRIPVYDSLYQPKRSKVRSRWLEGEAESAWRREEAGFVFSPKSNPWRDGTPATLSWLAYEHWRCCAHGDSRETAFPLEDIDSFNPSESRKLNPMQDIYIEINCSPSKAGLFICRLHRGKHPLELQFDFQANALRLSRLGENQQAAPSVSFTADSLKADSRDQDVSIEISTFDNHLLVLIQGQQIFSSPLESSLAKVAGLNSFLQLGAAGGGVKVTRVQLWRDVYYLSNDSPLLSAQSNEVILLGDNSVVSMDSRNWAKAGANRSQILGLVKNSEIE